MSEPKIHYADHLEQAVGTALETAGIEFLHNHNDLDFYLPKFDVYIEVKQFHADRIGRQMASRDNVIAVQGAKSIELITQLLLKPAALPVAPEVARVWWDRYCSQDENRQLWEKYNIDHLTDEILVNIYLKERDNFGAVAKNRASAENKGGEG